ncbi:YeeE/YedE family protein [Chitinophaga horti]|uniref:YeeE/YedE family protein n=1 Tax=Chitinophaga horti TaxID=2920382 RepID=A0ABY6J6F5_9BACT|nr:YeeE/YedE family protein [Chitinophaga horti]UYQ95258.1 YeeE/YedE family protein [Chitinophaga horti]
MEWIKQPWPWYIAGPLIGLIVPALLIAGNKAFGISSALRHICAACIPANISFFKYDWRKESWNLFFVGGITIGAFITITFLSTNEPIDLNPQTIADLKAMGLTSFDELLPEDIFNWVNVGRPVGLVFFVLGGFLVGFGTRYAGGCTSGHAIMGLSTFQWPSLVATCCFMAGGFLVTHLAIPYLLKLL